MVSKVFVLTCLTVALGQIPDDVWPTNQRGLKIPIDLGNRREEMRQLVLYTSQDFGRTWQQYAVAAPTDPEFIFHATSDGEYWFKAAVIDKQGKQVPQNIYQGPVDQKIRIDTVPPALRIIAAQRQGEDLLLRWEIEESVPDLSTLKLRYRPSEQETVAWLTLPLPPQLTGESRVRINHPGSVVLRLELKDLAGNSAYVDHKVAGLLNTVTTTAFDGSKGTMPPAPPQISPMQTPPTPAMHDQNNLHVPMPVPSQTMMENGMNLSQSPTQPLPTPPREIAGSTNATTSRSGPARTSPHDLLSNKNLPKLHFVNQTELTLEYELSSVGPSGIGAIELWLTQDNGATWRRFAEDPEVNAAMREGKYKRIIEVPGEGIYGFALVVKNRIGLGKPPPQPGEIPELRIEVDTTPPEAVLYAPVPNPKNRNALLISWEAKDRNLAANPITLEWAEQRDGPWHIIESGLANTGEFNWTVDKGMPVYVFLRMRIRDAAGNESIVISNNPLAVDLSEPEGRLIGVQISNGKH